MPLTLKNFIDIGMLSHLENERRFFETNKTNQGNTEIYWIERKLSNETYQFTYITKKCDAREEGLENHLEDIYVGGIEDLANILMRRMRRKPY
jgi:hypothetical protein